jgi:signal transduction histidine kinase
MPKYKAANAAQLQYFASMSHEIRTPLNCIIGFTSLLQDTLLSSFQKEAVDTIAASSDILQMVVSDIMDYSMLTTGNVEISIRPGDLQETLDTVVRSVELKGRDRYLTIITHYDGSVPDVVTTDCRRLQQVCAIDVVHLLYMNG